MFKAVVFDWSGTLSDDAALCVDARNIMVAKHGKPPITMDEYKLYYTMKDLVGFYRENHGINFESHEQMMREYEAALKESKFKPKPFPKARRTLKSLKKAGLKLFVLSAHPQSVLEKEAREYGFKDFFDSLVGSVWDKTETLKKIVKENGLAGEETLFVGDVILDVRAGKTAGVRTCACSYGYHPRAWLEREKPDFIIGDVSELLRVCSLPRPNA